MNFQSRKGSKGMPRKHLVTRSLPPAPECHCPCSVEGEREAQGEGAHGAEAAFYVRFHFPAEGDVEQLSQMSKPFQDAEELSPSPRLEGAELGLGLGTLASS